MQSDRAPRVSVVIPTYNRAALLCEAVDSALAQTYRDFEILVVDDGSTDATPAVVPGRFGGDPRVRYVRQENGGAAAAQNAGVRLARGEFIGLLGDDDLWRPEKLAWQVAALDRRPGAGLCFSDMVIAGGTDDGRRFFEIAGFDGTISVEALVRRNFIPAAATLIRRSCLLTAGAFDETLRLAEDWDLWIRLLAAHPAVCVDRVVGV
ncbi:MAG: glycosyltransferase family 2 protein [Candidatus Polarisedimenticolia bacterium]